MKYLIYTLFIISIAITSSVVLPGLTGGDLILIYSLTLLPYAALLGLYLYLRKASTLANAASFSVAVTIAGLTTVGSWVYYQANHSHNELSPMLLFFAPLILTLVSPIVSVIVYFIWKCLFGLDIKQGGRKA